MIRLAALALALTLSCVPDLREGSSGVSPVHCESERYRGYYAYCDGVCFALYRDPSHCGACGNACGGGVACATSLYQCEAHGLARCVTSRADLSTSSQHCGASDATCPGVWAGLASAVGVDRFVRLPPAPRAQGFGRSVAPAGDVNGDGLDDALAGLGPSAWALYLGGADAVTLSRVLEDTRGAALRVTNGDVDGDGSGDLGRRRRRPRRRGARGALGRRGLRALRARDGAPHARGEAGGRRARGVRPRRAVAPTAVHGRAERAHPALGCHSSMGVPSGSSRWAKVP